eukprot:COSAG01_NODE_4546_length_4932_cov_10.841092_4_plen_192_part_00
MVCLPQDMVKLSCLATVVLGTQQLAPAVLRSARVGRVLLGGPMSVSVVSATYSSCNQLGDAAGDVVQPLQAEIGLAFGLQLPRTAAAATPPRRDGMVDWIDDAVEDGWKVACLTLHARVGTLVGDALVAPTLLSLPLVGGPELVWAASWLVTICAIMGRYTDCDAYGDALGDAALLAAGWAQAWAQQRLAG